MRRGNAADKLVRLLSAAGQGAERVVTTALLALRVLTDRCACLPVSCTTPLIKCIISIQLPGLMKIRLMHHQEHHLRY